MPDRFPWMKLSLTVAFAIDAGALRLPEPSPWMMLFATLAFPVPVRTAAVPPARAAVCLMVLFVDGGVSPGRAGAVSGARGPSPLIELPLTSATAEPVAAKPL